MDVYLEGRWSRLIIILYMHGSENVEEKKREEGVEQEGGREREAGKSEEWEKEEKEQKEEIGVEKRGGREGGGDVRSLIRREVQINRRR